MPSQLKTIATFLTPEDAEVARLALEEEGISVFLEGATTVGMAWYYGNALGWVKLQVSESDEERARKILAEKVADSDDARLNVPFCPKCGTDIPPGFDVCWSCQSSVGSQEGSTSNQQTAALPTTRDRDQDEEEVVEEVAPDDEMAWRAFIAAIIGVPVFPPLLNIYSAWVLARIIFRGRRLSYSGRGSFWLAILTDAIVFLVVGWVLARGDALF